jgi:uncharacterized membrane protein YhaH (DUF805 family)
VNYFTSFYKNILNFEGVTDRREFWTTAATVAAVVFTASFITILVSQSYDLLGFIQVFGSILLLGTSVAFTAMSVRRVRDLGISGWFYLLVLVVGMIPVIGLVLQIIVFCLPTNCLKG